MEPLPRLSSHPAASCLAGADRPWRPTSSSRPHRYPQRPYYRFSYSRPRIVGRPGIVAENSARLPALVVPVVVLGRSAEATSPPDTRPAWAAHPAGQPRRPARCPSATLRPEPGGPIPRSFNLAFALGAGYNEALDLVTSHDVVLARREWLSPSRRAGVGGHNTPAVVVVDPGADVTQPCSEWRASDRALQSAKKPGDTGAPLDEHGQVFFTELCQDLHPRRAPGQGPAGSAGR